MQSTGLASVTISTNHDAVALVDDTSGQQFHRRSHTLSALFLHRGYRYGWLFAALIVFLLAQVHPAQAAPRGQSNPGTSPQLYLLPREGNGANVVVDSHIAPLRVVDDASGPLLNVSAIYRLRNQADSEVTLPLMLFPGGDLMISSFQNLSLTQNQQALLLQPAEGGGFFSQITLTADERTTLLLQ